MHWAAALARKNTTSATASDVTSTPPGVRARIEEDARRWLSQQPWRGNVRELVNTVERATIISPGPVLEFGDSAPEVRGPVAVTGPSDGGSILTLQEMERRHIERALHRTDGKISGKGGAAEILGINPNTLRSRMKKLGVGGGRSHRPS